MANPSVPPAELAKRFAHHPPSSQFVIDLHEATRDRCHRLAEWMNAYLPESREKSMALTKVQEAMWAANAAIALEQPDDADARAMALGEHEQALHDARDEEALAIANRERDE